MRHFFEAYRGEPKLSTVLRELPWSAHLHILSRSKHPQEREFYVHSAVRNRWPVREVARQIDSGLFEQAVLSPPKLPDKRLLASKIHEFYALSEPEQTSYTIVDDVKPNTGLKMTTQSKGAERNEGNRGQVAGISAEISS